MTKPSRSAGRPDRIDLDKNANAGANAGPTADGDPGGRPFDADADAPGWVRRLARMLATTPERLVDAGTQNARARNGEPGRAEALGQVRLLGPGAQAAVLLRRRAAQAARRMDSAAE